MGGLRATLVEVIREVVGDGPSEKELNDAASALIAVMDGLQVQWLLDPDAVDMPGTVELVMNEIIERLASGHEAPSARARAEAVLDGRTPKRER
jgi:hypothetical protein